MLMTDFLVNMSVSADVLAEAKVEVGLGQIPEGKNVCHMPHGNSTMSDKTFDSRSLTRDRLSSGGAESRCLSAIARKARSKKPVRWTGSLFATLNRMKTVFRSRNGWSCWVSSASGVADGNRALTTLGVCTHLGCVPIGEAGEYGGWFCPCHGSHYDISGRARRGPAPLNLEVPQYHFVEESMVIG